LKLRAFLFVAFGLLASVGFAGCGGGGASTPSASTAGGSAIANGDATPAQSSNFDTASHTVVVAAGPKQTTATFVLVDGSRGSLTLHSASANASLNIQTGAAAQMRATESTGTCPAPVPIVISNRSSHPVSVTLDSFTVQLPCSVNGLLFGASAYQSNPVPASLVSTKLGNAKGTGNSITFTPTVSQLTFPANTTLTISILLETSTAFAQLPAVVNSALTLTSNAPQVPNSLALSASSVSGGTTFQSACYLPSDPAGPGLSGQPILGTASFYCVLLPGQTGTSTSFGSNGSNGAVTFTLGPNAKPDSSYVSLDGPPIFAPCTPADNGQTCSAKPFSLPAYSKAIVGNVASIAVCTPATTGTDCNGVDGNPTAPSATSVPGWQAFQLLLADDPSYNAANTFGGLTLHISARWQSCTIDLGPAAGNAPPGYSEPGPPASATPVLANYTGVGPYVALSIYAENPGTCTVALTEDTGLKRTFTFQITVAPNSGW
jgi:hypothetical protein